MVIFCERWLTRLLHYVGAVLDEADRRSGRYCALASDMDFAYWKQWPQPPFPLWRVMWWLKRRGWIVGPEGSTVEAHRVRLVR